MSRPFPSPVPRLAASIDGAVATLAIDNAPRRNAIDLAMWDAIPALIAALDSDPAVRAIVIRGADDGPFSAGADISEFETARGSAAGSRAYEAANVRAFEAVAGTDHPTIAMIRGHCIGGGLGLALACDLRVAADDAVFAIPAGRLGVGYPPSGMATIVSVVGASAARDLFFTGRRIDAAQAMRIGLLREVVPVERLATHVGDLAATIAAQAPLTLTAAKRAIEAAAGLPGRLPDAAIQALADACFDSEDCAEGRRAFLAKRRPEFRGR